MNDLNSSFESMNVNKINAESLEKILLMMRHNSMDEISPLELANMIQKASITGEGTSSASSEPASTTAAPQAPDAAHSSVKPPPPPPFAIPPPPVIPSMSAPAPAKAPAATTSPGANPFGAPATAATVSTPSPPLSSTSAPSAGVGAGDAEGMTFTIGRTVTTPRSARGSGAGGGLSGGSPGSRKMKARGKPSTPGSGSLQSSATKLDFSIGGSNGSQATADGTSMQKLNFGMEKVSIDGTNGTTVVPGSGSAGTSTSTGPGTSSSGFDQKENFVFSMGTSGSGPSSGGKGQKHHNHSHGNNSSYHTVNLNKTLTSPTSSSPAATSAAVTAAFSFVQPPAPPTAEQAKAAANSKSQVPPPFSVPIGATTTATPPLDKNAGSGVFTDFVFDAGKATPGAAKTFSNQPKKSSPGIHNTHGKMSPNAHKSGNGRAPPSPAKETGTSTASMKDAMNRANAATAAADAALRDGGSRKGKGSSFKNPFSIDSDDDSYIDGGEVDEESDEKEPEVANWRFGTGQEDDDDDDDEDDDEKDDDDGEGSDGDDIVSQGLYETLHKMLLERGLSREAASIAAAEAVREQKERVLREKYEEDAEEQDDEDLGEERPWEGQSDEDDDDDDVNDDESGSDEGAEEGRYRKEVVDSDSDGDEEEAPDAAASSDNDSDGAGEGDETVDNAAEVGVEPKINGATISEKTPGWEKVHRVKIGSSPIPAAGSSAAGVGAGAPHSGRESGSTVGSPMDCEEEDDDETMESTASTAAGAGKQLFSSSPFVFQPPITSSVPADSNGNAAHGASGVPGGSDQPATGAFTGTVLHGNTSGSASASATAAATTEPELTFSLGSTGNTSGGKKKTGAGKALSSSMKIPTDSSAPIFGATNSATSTSAAASVTAPFPPPPPPPQPPAQAQNTNTAGAEKEGRRKSSTGGYYNKRTGQFYDLSDDDDDGEDTSTSTTSFAGDAFSGSKTVPSASAKAATEGMAGMDISGADSGAGSYPTARPPMKSAIPPPVPPAAGTPSTSMPPPPPPRAPAADAKAGKEKDSSSSGASNLNSSMSVMADTYRKHGKEHYEKEEYDKALEKFSKALQISPMDWFYRATVLGNRAATYMMVDRYAEAADDCAAALQLDKSLIRLHSRRGRALTKVGHFEGAASCFNKVLEITSDAATAKPASAYASTSSRISAASAAGASEKTAAENASNREDAKAGLKQVNAARELVQYILNFDDRGGSWLLSSAPSKAGGRISGAGYVDGSEKQTSDILLKIEELLAVAPQMRLAQSMKAKGLVKLGCYSAAKRYVEGIVCTTHHSILSLHNPNIAAATTSKCPTAVDLMWKKRSSSASASASASAAASCLDVKTSSVVQFFLFMGTAGSSTSGVGGRSPNGQLAYWYLQALKNQDLTRLYSNDVFATLTQVLDAIYAATRNQIDLANKSAANKEKVVMWVADEMEKCRQLATLKAQADSSFKAGSFAEALRLYTEVLKVDSEAVRWNAIIYGNRAAAYMSLNCYSEAVNDCNKAVVLDADYARVYLRRARAHKAQHHYAASIRDYKRYLTSDPTPADAVAIQKEMENTGAARDAYTATKTAASSSSSGNSSARPSFWDSYSKSAGNDDDDDDDQQSSYSKSTYKSNLRPDYNRKANEPPKPPNSHYSRAQQKSGYGKFNGKLHGEQESEGSDSDFSTESDDDDADYTKSGNTKGTKSAYDYYSNFHKATRENTAKSNAPPHAPNFKPTPNGAGAANTMPPPPPPPSSTYARQQQQYQQQYQKQQQQKASSGGSDDRYQYVYNPATGTYTKPPKTGPTPTPTPGSSGSSAGSKPSASSSNSSGYSNPYAKYYSDYYGTSAGSSSNSKYYNYTAGGQGSASAGGYAGATGGTGSQSNEDFYRQYTSGASSAHSRQQQQQRANSSSSQQRTSSSQYNSQKTSSNTSSSGSASGGASNAALMSESTDYYHLLGVNSRATEREIKLSYRKLALQYHPDKNKNDSAKVIFQNVTNAYTTLMDKTSRRKYDVSRPL